MPPDSGSHGGLEGLRDGLGGAISNGVFKAKISPSQIVPQGSPSQGGPPSFKLSPLSLPQLLIPATGRHVSVDTPPSSALDTPQYPPSPITGVVDLTNSIKTLNESPVTTGGFSDIYRAEWSKETRAEVGRIEIRTVLVAVKLLRVLAVKDLDCEKLQKRLNREVYVWHRLEHPNIAKLFGTSYHMSGRPAMVMKWYCNGSAQEYLRDHSDVNRLLLVRDVANGLEHLHTLTPPIVHGDLKSNNVLITDDGAAVLSDFGLSQVIGDILDRPVGLTPSNPSGPIRWQAPELLEDESSQPGLKTDVWGFGCTAYEILTSKLPYDHRRRDALILKDVQSRIKPSGPDRFSITGSDGSIEVILEDSCWAFDPYSRPCMGKIFLLIDQLCQRSDGNISPTSAVCYLKDHVAAYF